MTTQSIAQQVQERKRRGVALLTADAANVAQVSHTLYLVRGSEGSDYKVVMTDKQTCECKDFQHHGAALGTCKHIEAVRVFNLIYRLIGEYGDDLLTLRAITRAGSGPACTRAVWEAVLSVLRYRAGLHTPAAVLTFPTIARVAEMAAA